MARISIANVINLLIKVFNIANFIVSPVPLRSRNINLNYKRKAISEQWKKGHLSVIAVQNRFRKIKFNSTIRKIIRAGRAGKICFAICRWEKNIMRGRSNRDKLVFIVEYVLTQFQEAIERGPIVEGLIVEYVLTQY
ncbi:hypothetical protein ACFW04_013732 [Cataglyphis niger]